MLKANTDLVGSSKRIDWGVSHHPRVMLTLTGVVPAKGKQERPAQQGGDALSTQKIWLQQLVPKSSVLGPCNQYPNNLALEMRNEVSASVGWSLGNSPAIRS